MQFVCGWEFIIKNAKSNFCITCDVFKAGLGWISEIHY